MTNKTLKKTLLWLKTHWYIPALVVAVIFLSVASKQKAQALIDIIKSNRKNYEDAIKKIDKINKEETKEIQKIEQDKEAKIIELDKERDKQLLKVEDNKKRNVERLKTGTNKELADKLKKEFDL